MVFSAWLTPIILGIIIFGIYAIAGNFVTAKIAFIILASYDIIAVIIFYFIYPRTFLRTSLITIEIIWILEPRQIRFKSSLHQEKSILEHIQFKASKVLMWLSKSLMGTSNGEWMMVQ